MVLLAPQVVAILAAFAGGPVTVTCSANVGSDTIGLADPDSRTIEFLDFRCQDINLVYRLKRLPKPIRIAPGETLVRDMQASESMYWLLHEATHIRYPDVGMFKPESCVSKYALSRLGAFAKRLGIKRKVRRQIVRLAREENATDRTNYQARRCRQF